MDTELETMGAFYLGRLVDKAGTPREDAPLLYDAKDLCTHGVCVGMTGSGKTGLCISLLEEAAIDGIPTIAIDPKGDLGNLLLTFPDLSPAQFEPWIDPDEALRRGETVAQRAEATASSWREGLAAWGQGPERIRRLREAAQIDIYTPGHSSGRQLTVLRSFAPPSASVQKDADAFRDHVSSTTSGLLALLGISADPLRSREHILVSMIFRDCWSRGTTLDLPAVIGLVQSPPFSKVGVVDIESFFPKKERQELALSINGLLASPSFAGWLEGEPLDIKQLLWTKSGKPRISILNIAHLGESERMFFVTLLLSELVSWMRSQSGTSSLRALLYMDEVFGFFPPVANPPSKAPMLTLLKQARAYGLGVLLSTQNPVDLDYKGLSNTGTWFIGRMQTERDVARVVDGLEGAATAAGNSFDRQAMTARIAGLGKRVFVMNNVHESAPVTFKSRWAMSYLRGPLTRDHIATLMAERKASAGAAAAAAREASATPATPATPAAPAEQNGEDALAVDSEVEQLFAAEDNMAGSEVPYTPELYAQVDLHYSWSAKDIDEWSTVHCRAVLDEESVKRPWEGLALSSAGPGLHPAALASVPRAPLPPAGSRHKSYASWEKQLKTAVYKSCSLDIFTCTPLKLTSKIGEDEADFRLRVRDAAREKRDLAIEKLRASYGKKLATLQDRIARAQEKLEDESAQLSQAKTSTAVSAGATILGAIFGRKVASVGTVGRAGSTVRRAGKVQKEAQDVEQAKESLASLRQKLTELEAELKEKVSDSEDLVSPDSYPIKSKSLRPKKADIDIKGLRLLWIQRRPQG